jgi:hypothetical protein
MDTAAPGRAEVVETGIMEYWNRVMSSKTQYPNIPLLPICRYSGQATNSEKLWPVLIGEQTAPSLDRRDNTGTHQVVPNLDAHICESRLAEFLL